MLRDTERYDLLQLPTAALSSLVYRGSYGIGGLGSRQKPFNLDESLSRFKDVSFIVGICHSLHVSEMLEVADQRSSRMIPETIRFDWSHFSLVAESEHLQQRSLLCMVAIVVPILALGQVWRRG